MASQFGTPQFGGENFGGWGALESYSFTPEAYLNQVTQNGVMGGAPGVAANGAMPGGNFMEQQMQMQQ